MYNYINSINQKPVLGVLRFDRRTSGGILARMITFAHATKSLPLSMHIWYVNHE